MSNRQTGGIPTKVRMPPVFEITVLANFLKIAQLQEMTYREDAFIQPLSVLVKHESYQEENHSNTNKPSVARSEYSGGALAGNMISV